MSILFLVIGNSGAGKDTVIKAVLEKYPPQKKTLKVPRRVVTRKISLTEDFESVDVDTFLKLKEEDELILDWASYDHYYGIRREINEWMKSGHPVMVNVSRNIIESARERFPKVKVIFIRVPLDITADRIIERGRESYEEVLDRVVRAQNLQDFHNADLIVENVGKIEETSQKILEFIIDSIKVV
jgi:ribose 1,5-bisphosphokinase